MTEATTQQPETPDEAVRPGVFRRMMRNPLGATSVVILAVVILAGIIGPWLTPFAPNHADLSNALLGPGSGGHLLGTDTAGRDILSRLLAGARMTLLAAALAMGVAMVVGVPTGLIAGYYGGWFDAIASWWTNVLMSLPAIIVLLAATAALGKTVWVSMGIFGLLMSPGVFRLTRTTVQAVRGELYVDAARVAGLSDLSIIGRHILFVVRAPMIIQAAVIAGIAISIQAMLEFLGLGDPLVPTWGVMLNEGFVNIYTAPILTLWPGLAISLTIGSFVVFGNALRDALEDSPSTQGATVGRPVRAIPSADDRGAPVEEHSDSPAGDHLLEVRHLGIGYPHPGGGITEVVRDVTLHLDRGEVLGVVGESGSGKTQTAFSVLGLLPQEAVITHGTIEFDGRTLLLADGDHVEVGDMGPLRGTRIGYIPQEPMSNLDPNFTVGHQLARPMRSVLGLSRAEATERALDLLRIVGLPNPRRTFGAYPHQISGGMAQRVLIAGAVSCNPDMLIADEPTTALDVTVQAEVLDLLRDLQQRFDMGVLLVTHNFGVVADVCDRVVVMQNGRLVESGDVRSIMRHPQHPYTRSLLDAMLEGKAPMTMLTTEDSHDLISAREA